MAQTIIKEEKLVLYSSLQWSFRIKGFKPKHNNLIVWFNGFEP